MKNAILIGLLSGILAGGSFHASWALLSSKIRATFYGVLSIATISSLCSSITIVVPLLLLREFLEIPSHDFKFFYVTSLAGGFLLGKFSANRWKR